MPSLDPHRGSVMVTALVLCGAALAAGRPPVARATGQATATLGGRLTFEGTAPPRPTDVARVTILARPVQPGLPVVETTARADGSFEFSDLAPGRYRLAAALPPAPAGSAASAVPRWVLKSVMLAGADVADVPFDVRGADKILSITVAMSDRITDLSGALLDSNNQPVAGRTVVVFASDSRFWFTGSRRTPSPVRSSESGAFRFTGLPAGDYRIAALADAGTITITETLLTQLAQRSVQFTLAAGEARILNLQVGR